MCFLASLSPVLTGPKCGNRVSGLIGPFFCYQVLVRVIIWTLCGTRELYLQELRNGLI